MALDLVGITNSFYDRLASASAGSTARASLGGASSVIPADQLNSASLPATVFVVFRARGGRLGERDGNTIFFQWWIYDNQVRSPYRRINTTIPLLEALYSEHAIPAIQINPEHVVSDEATDHSLNLSCRSITWQVYNRQ